MSAVDFEESRAYEEDDRSYDRGRDSPRGGDPRGGDSRARSASPDNRDDHGGSRQAAADKEEEAARNPGSNLFVTGIHPRLSEDDVTQLFEKYGEVEKANIMRDPHSGDSRGFGFVKMVTPEQADAAREGLHGVLHEGRTLSIEKARRAKPRTPTPGKYYGPPKRDFGSRPPRGGGRFDDRRGGGYGRRDEYYGGGYRGGTGRYGGGGGGGGGDRYDEYGSGSGSDRRYRDRGEYGRSDRQERSERTDRYRDDRYTGREGGRDGGREERRGGGGGYYGGGREDRGGYGDAAPPRDSREAYGGGHGYDEPRGDYR